MKTVTIQDIKKKGAKGISDDDVVYLIVNSKLKSAILPIHQYEELMEMLEDLEDIREAEAREDDEVVSAEEVYAELGL